MTTLAELRPTQPGRLIDLVRAAGIDVSDWANCKGGVAARNPKDCYEWAFVEPKKLVVLNVWHDHIEESADGTISIEMDEREFASRRTGTERARALRTDEALQVAAKERLPVRIVVLDGRRRNIDNPGERASHVSKRLLDPARWTVTTYNWKTGECTVTRGTHRFVDQFSLQETERKPERREVSGLAFVRSSIVRSNVLVRANGRCEWCGTTGFVMTDGRIYLETHHVIPLSEDGPDVESNVAGLCPNHHCEAHHGKNRGEMRKKMLERLKRSLM